ncbi:hypothetical protein ABMY44_09165 [Pseudoalteromonas sp. Cnat2-41]|uniref:hypothetical protein n=1 Tax=unclassified Pseudoalteromonas TaxID=194690 RepID=UPI001EF927A9|nr:MULTISPECIES: hypothetical protein [unclassified Pseudoalteromonas]MCF2862032.1 hypothetical protein [Pseudoalteromonas sp. CNAT2-18]MCG7558199.1 hypothetical protein [Pseudoalteromonas sp. CNAT2-18.1]
MNTIYGNAACVDTRGGAAADDLAPINEGKIAYELTGDLTVDLDNITADVDATTGDDLQVVYIPTTDIPGGTKITMEITGALFAGNGNQIHLVKDADLADPLDNGFEAVGSSDGTVDGTNTITFITKAGVTIGAGTRLALSRVSSGAAITDVVPVGLKIENDTCTNANSSKLVQIRSTEAVTDGGTGYSIIGGVSEATTVIDISPQFYTFFGSTTAEAEVNAESSDSAGDAIIARTEFVYNAGDVTDQLVAKQHEVVYKTAFYNRGGAGGDLDQAITLDADDHLETAFLASAEPGATVKMALWNGRTAATGVLDTQEEVETGTLLGDFGLTEATATVYNTEALDIFTPATAGDAEANPAAATSNLFGADYNEMFYVVTNTIPAGATDYGVMNFNYNVKPNYTLDFGTATELDHCKDEVTSHEIGVNGAVLKVPYAVSAEGNFVRVTNEHDEAAEVTVDLFSESDNGNLNNRKVTAVQLGTVPAKSSVVYFVPELVSEAEAQQGYTSADGGFGAGDLGSNAGASTNRHTLTFTVTAPRDSVHGVSVQRIVGGVDRVMPVLDQNEWSQ